MNEFTKASLFSELQKLYGDSTESISEIEILAVLDKVNTTLTTEGSGISHITPNGFYKMDGWKKGLVHEVFSDEYYREFASMLMDIRERLQLDSLSVLEVGAGSGVFSERLRKKVGKDISITATDIVPNSDNVSRYGYKEAIDQFQPQIVIACWPLIIANIDGESVFIRTLIDNPAVKGCFLIGTPSRCQFDEGWFQDYQEESGSTFTNIMDIPELSKLQIGISRKSGNVPIKNGINPLFLMDQGIDDRSLFLGDTYVTSRTSYISRGNPKW